jgi:hypothetical protein
MKHSADDCRRRASTVTTATRTATSGPLARAQAARITQPILSYHKQL